MGNRHALAAIFGMVVALATHVAGPAAPAEAAPGCTSEVRPTPSLTQPFPASCDDSNPPDTRISALDPAPNDQGWLRTGSASFSFASQVDDDDAGPFSFECRLSGPAGTTAAHDWRTCTSPTSYAGLADTSETPYVFEVRAVDSGDSSLVPLNGLGAPTADTPDHDLTPAAVTWRVDSLAPREFLTVDAYDELTPDRPVLRSREVVAAFNSSEPAARLECTDLGEPLACARGRQRLTALASGHHRVSVRAVDVAGNASGWAEPQSFTVPDNLIAPRGRRGRAWRTREAEARFDGDVVISRRRGARLLLPRSKVRELRVYADTAPWAGAIRVRVGRRAWHRVDLSGPRASGQEFSVIGPWEGVRSGRVVVEVLTRGRPVRLDAILVR